MYNSTSPRIVLISIESAPNSAAGTLTDDMHLEVGSWKVFHIFSLSVRTAGDEAAHTRASLSLVHLIVIFRRGSDELFASVFLSEVLFG